MLRGAARSVCKVPNGDGLSIPVGRTILSHFAIVIAHTGEDPNRTPRVEWV